MLLSIDDSTHESIRRSIYIIAVVIVFVAITNLNIYIPAGKIGLLRTTRDLRVAENSVLITLMLAMSYLGLRYSLQVTSQWKMRLGTLAAIKNQIDKTEEYSREFKALLKNAQDAETAANSLMHSADKFIGLYKNFEKEEAETLIIYQTFRTIGTIISHDEIMSYVNQAYIDLENERKVLLKQISIITKEPQNTNEINDLIKNQNDLSHMVSNAKLYAAERSTNKVKGKIDQIRDRQQNKKGEVEFTFEDLANAWSRLKTFDHAAANELTESIIQTSESLAGWKKSAAKKFIIENEAAVKKSREAVSFENTDKIILTPIITFVVAMGGLIAGLIEVFGLP